MSVLAIPFREILNPNTSTESVKKAKKESTHNFHEKRSPLRNVSSRDIRREHWTENRNGNNVNKFLSSASCDPLLDFIKLADFEDDEKLQRNFEEILEIRKMGFPVKIVKKSWFPGLICIPIFHCQRCLALWTQAAQVTTFCSEVNRSVYGRLIPISITKCDLIARLFNHDRKPTAKRLCEQLLLSKPDCKPVKPVMNVKERSPDDSFGKRIFKPIPVAEFVDIDEMLRKYRKKFLRKLKGIGSNASGRLLDTAGRTSSPVVVGDIRSDDEVKAERENEETGSKCDKKICNEERSAVDEELKSNLKSENFNPRAHARTCYSNRHKSYKEGARARPSTPRGFGNGLKITSKKQATKPTPPAAARKLSSIPQHVSKINRPTPIPYQPLSTPDIQLEVAYENKLAELRKKTLGFDKEILKDVWGDRFETLDQNVITSCWFKSLVEEISQQTESLNLFKSELTRAFCFSYFELLRNNNTK